MAYGLVKEVDNLRKTTFDTISDGMRPMSMDFILPGSGFVSFKSRHEVTKKVMDMLNDSKVRIIGVYGLGGVGKTTFVKKVARKAINDKLFDMVVFAHVTSTPDIKKIQSELADQLGVRFDKDSEIGRASRLQDIFNNEKKNTLVILDDLWVRLDLNKLGIPVDGANPSSKSVEGIYNFKMSKDEVTNDSKRFKILLTSRDREVLSGKMELKDNSIFSLKGLQDEEAEILFKKVTRVNEKSHDFQQLAITISKKCGGLPITIITVGRTLRTKNYIEWKDALGQLERKNFIGVDESLHFSTKLSFYYLENEDLKSTFLLCAQLGHHPLIMELVKYCIGLGIFKGFLSIRKTREKILTLIKRLKDSSLLVNSYSNDYFNMHDVICDAALSIAYEDQHILTMRNEKLSEWPHSNEFEMYNAISIHNCDTHDELPNFVSCPKLKMFHIDSLDPSFRLPDNFFNTMGILKALILTCVDLSNSLTLISCLTNLRMLCLEQCMLGDISFIGEMKKLRILSLSRSNIQSLPATIGQLCKLQLLDISNCIELREIPPNVLSGLTNLEELYMTNSVKWKSEGNRSGNAILAELRYLHQLKSLDICILDAASLPWNLFLDNLDSYKIVIGNFKTLSVGDFNMSNKDENSRALALQIKERNHIHTHKAIKLLFKKVEKLLLGEVGVQNIF
ncbi:probable disease resistance protein At4g27220 isoform X1 [Prosopis cineraria]|uniref:probable disease resistance protein At4g27220 isoform X1 n=1 Tax=Prosopis cineraria TaxID=364024 RepID=UPI00240F328F|nr:probable disease resistance protein At4g27220 isoform X1 [Prosopis cineraria]XP_054818937.1 probable disease resistance protein At4g27220 isoform X1 [Prosopis cineraria]XP_054818938.1 probable disease resistance protein At4g27220 isoform X1 [Prosopis cineraria]XP_054818939.1 probable disease resistance protein At4g27220 isoform X1 [Prosopis cineraria]